METIKYGTSQGLYKANDVSGKTKRKGTMARGFTVIQFVHTVTYCNSILLILLKMFSQFIAERLCQFNNQYEYAIKDGLDWNFIT